MRIGFMLVILFFLNLEAQGANLTLYPEKVFNGEAAIVRWYGETPSFAVLRFDNRIIYFYPDPDGAIALLPIRLDMPSGPYPLLCAIVDQNGDTIVSELTLQVRQKDRPLERLILPKQYVSPKDPDVLKRIEQEARLLKKLFAGRSPRLWETFQRPVEEPVNSIFGKKRLLNGIPRSPHSGTDFRSPEGTPVKSISEGSVVLVENLFYTGLTVIVDHGQGLYSVYAHLSEQQVTVGEQLSSGQILGRVGRTGRATGAHLHLSVRLLGERIDPMALLDLMKKEDS